jgi:5-methylcytosine-specific restriction endonuclease McrA
MQTNDYAEAIKQIKHFNWVDPHADVLSFLEDFTTKNNEKSKRTFALYYLKKNDEKLCVWCLKNRLTGRQQKYCSFDCKMSCYIYANPQDDCAKAYVLIYKQNCACAVCGLSYEDLIIKGVSRMLKRKSEWETFKIKHQLKGEFDPWIGTLVDNTGHIIQVDHIIPIFKGGAAIGLQNIQVICSGCHMVKTASERR